MKKVKSIVLCVIYCSMIIVGLKIISGFPTSVQAPPVSGDWIVTGSETLSGEWKLNGSIIVNSTGSLTISNSKLIFAGVSNGSISDGEWNITVLSGGTLTIQNSEITSDGKNYKWYLQARKGSSLSITNCEFSRGGTNQFGMLTIETSGVSIIGSRIIASSIRAIVGDNTSDLTITDTEIIANQSTYAIYLDSMRNTVITRCNLSSNHANTLLYMRESTDTTIQDSTITNDYLFIPIYLVNSSRTSILRNNFTSSSVNSATTIADSSAYLDKEVIIDSNTFTYLLPAAQEIINFLRVSQLTISNNKLIGAQYGVEIDFLPSEYISIFGNTFTSHSMSAVKLSSVNHASISNNIIEDVENNAIECRNIANIEISSNIIKNVTANAISLSSCNDTEIRSNLMTQISDDVISVVGDYNENISIVQNQIMNNKMDAIDVTNVTDCRVEGNYIKTMFSNAIRFSDSNSISINQNTVIDITNDGIYLYRCSNTNITQNKISDVGSQSIYVNNNNGGYNIESNDMNTGYDGIYVLSSPSGRVRNNIIKSVSHYALYFSSSSSEVDVLENVAVECRYGLFNAADNNTIMNNSFLFNNIGVVHTFSSEDNFIVYNNFISNIDQAQDDGTDNLFSFQVLGVYFGNYWDDYSGIDVLDPIGFGDTPYNSILGSSGNTDEYPLMNPVNNEALEPPSISHPADLTYTEGTTGNILVWSGSSLIPESYTVSINGSTVDSGVWNDQVVIISVDGLSVGSHIVKCTFVDKLGQSTYDIVEVTVVEASTGTNTTSQATTQPETSATTNTSGTTFDPIPSFMLGMISSLGLVVIVVILLRIAKRRKG